jgi:hypothetical protein
MLWLTVGRWTDLLNYWALWFCSWALVHLFPSKLRVRPGDTADRVPTPDTDPHELFDYVDLLLWTWVLLTAVCLALTSVVGRLLTKVDGCDGTTIGVAIIGFAGVFCVVGVADALWRRYPADAARRRYDRIDRVVDDRVRELVAAARLNDGTILLQFAAAAAAATILFIAFWGQ